MDAAILQLAEHDNDHGLLQHALGRGKKRSRDTAVELQDEVLVVSRTTAGQEQQQRGNKTHGAVEITAIKLWKLAGGEAVQVKMTRQPSETVTTWIIFVDGSYRPGVTWGDMAMSGGAYCRCNSSDSRLRQVADTLGFAVLLLAQQRIPLDSTHAELGAMWTALKKLRWAVEQGLLGWGRHKVKLLCDCDTIAKTLSPEGGRIDPRFWPLLSDTWSMMTAVIDYGIDVAVLWVPGHQNTGSIWAAGNNEAHQRSTAQNVNEVVRLPSLSPAAAGESLGTTEADADVRSLFALGEVIAQDPKHRPELLIRSMLPISFAAASAHALIAVPESVPTFLPKPRRKPRRPRHFERMPAHAYRRGAGYPHLRSMQRGPPPQQRHLKRSGNYGPRHR